MRRLKNKLSNAGKNKNKKVLMQTGTFVKMLPVFQQVTIIVRVNEHPKVLIDGIIKQHLKIKTQQRPDAFQQLL